MDPMTEPCACHVQITTPKGDTLIKTHQEFLDVVLPKIEHNKGWVVNFLKINEELICNRGVEVNGDLFNFKNFRFVQI